MSERILVSVFVRYVSRNANPYWPGRSNMRFFARWFKDEEAATAVEYAVLLGLILVAVILSIGAVGSETGGMWGGIDSQTETAGLGK